MEESSMELILHAGNAHSYAMEAIACARESKMAEAKAAMEAAVDEQGMAHKYQTELISRMAEALTAGKKPDSVTILLVHALDHVNSGNLCIDFARELIVLYEKLETLQQGGGSVLQ